jgi:sucrose phosphorylase
LQSAELEAELSDKQSLRHQVFLNLSSLLKMRAGSSAFHPAGDQRVIRCHDGIFALARTSLDGSDRVLCLHNVTGESLDVSVDVGTSFIAPANNLVDLVDGQASAVENNRIELSLESYQFRWFQAE